MAKKKITEQKNKSEKPSPGQPEVPVPTKPEKSPDQDKIDSGQINDPQLVIEPIRIDEPDKIDPVQIKLANQ